MGFMKRKINIGIVEDNSTLRKRLVEHLGFYEDLNVCLSAGSSEVFLHRIETLAASSMPDVILMDIELPGLSGIETTSLVKMRHEETAILMFTVFEDDERIFASIKAGASGYLLKDEPVEVIVNALRELHKGGAPMSQVIAKKLLKMVRDERSGNPGWETNVTPFELSTREIEILQLLVDGLTNNEIGEALFLSPWTIKTHIKNIYRKMHVSSRAEVTRLAIKQNLV